MIETTKFSIDENMHPYSDFMLHIKFWNMFKSNHLTEFQKSNYNNLSPTEKQTLYFEPLQVATFCVIARV